MSREDWSKKALEFIQNKQGPVLVGEVALFLGPICSLEDAERILTDLAEAGKIRPLTRKELQEKDLRLAFVWCKMKA